MTAERPQFPVSQEIEAELLLASEQNFLPTFATREQGLDAIEEITQRNEFSINDLFIAAAAITEVLNMETGMMDDIILEDEVVEDVGFIGNTHIELEKRKGNQPFGLTRDTEIDFVKDVPRDDVPREESISILLDLYERDDNEVELWLVLNRDITGEVSSRIIEYDEESNESEFPDTMTIEDRKEFILGFEEYLKYAPKGYPDFFNPPEEAAD